MRKVEEGPKLTQAWCPFFPNGCPPTFDPHRAEVCPLNAEHKFTCTLDRACQPRPVVNGIVMRRNNKRREVLLVLRHKTKTQPGKWAIPGGGIHCGESVESAIVREVKEETGYGIELIDSVIEFEEGPQRFLSEKLVPFQVVSADGMDDHKNYVGFFAFCRVVKEPEAEPDDEFTERCHWFDMDTVKELIEQDRLTPLDTSVMRQLIFRSM